MTDEATPQLTLDWLEIRKFRNVEPCRLEFGKGHNVISPVIPGASRSISA